MAMSSDFATIPAECLDRLTSLLGAKGCKLGQDAQRYCDDPRGRFSGQLAIVLLPASTMQVSEIVKICAAFKVGIIPYGGGTGVVAGQLSPHNPNAVILSLEKMNRVRSINLDEGVMVVEAGCILERIHQVAADHEMDFPLSMASKGSCTIGGNLATNAGGIQVVRHGNARDLCLGIEAVLPNGDILNELSPLRKNNTGYDLRHLLIGAEGTLGVITAATLKIIPQPAVKVTAMLAVSSPSEALAVYRDLGATLGPEITALELMSSLGLHIVRRHFPSLAAPFSAEHPWFLLIETAGASGLKERMEACLEQTFEKGLVLDAVVAQSEAQRDGLWDLRELTPEANKAEGAFCNSDTAVPIAQIAPFIRDTQAALEELHSGIRVNSYGHIGDGNIHHNVFPPEGISKAEFVIQHPEMVEDVRQAINHVTVRYDGAISAEHGIGRLKINDLEAHASKAKLHLLRAIKQAIDPDNIMNPGAMVRLD